VIAAGADQDTLTATLLALDDEAACEEFDAWLLALAAVEDASPPPPQAVTKRCRQKLPISHRRDICIFTFPESAP